MLGPSRKPFKLFSCSAESFEDAQRLAQADVVRRMPLKIDSLNTQLPWCEKLRELARLFQLQAAKPFIVVIRGKPATLS